MKKFGKLLSALAVAVIGLATLVSCGGYNFYNVMTEAGAIIDKDHCYEVIEIEDAKNKIEADETFILALGSPISKTANTIGIIDEQSEIFNFEGKIYFIDVEDEIKNIEDRNTLNKDLGISNSADAKTNLIIVIYNKGEVLIDTTNKASYDDFEWFAANNSVDYYALAAYMFNDLKFE